MATASAEIPGRAAYSQYNNHIYSPPTQESLCSCPPAHLKQQNQLGQQSRGLSALLPPPNDPETISQTHNGPTVAATSLRQSTTKMRKRSKTGCLTCRKRRIKCGEERPTCANCIKSKRQCEGYNQRVVFKPPIGDWPNHPGVVSTIQYHTSFLPGTRNYPLREVRNTSSSLKVDIRDQQKGSGDEILRTLAESSYRRVRNRGFSLGDMMDSTGAKELPLSSDGPPEPSPFAKVGHRLPIPAFDSPTDTGEAEQGSDRVGAPFGGYPRFQQTPKYDMNPLIPQASVKAPSPSVRSTFFDPWTSLPRIYYQQGTKYLASPPNPERNLYTQSVIEDSREDITEQQPSEHEAGQVGIDSREKHSPSQQLPIKDSVPQDVVHKHNNPETGTCHGTLYHTPMITGSKDHRDLSCMFVVDGEKLVKDKASLLNKTMDYFHVMLRMKTTNGITSNDEEAEEVSSISADGTETEYSYAQSPFDQDVCSPQSGQSSSSAPTEASSSQQLSTKTKGKRRQRSEAGDQAQSDDEGASRKPRRENRSMVKDRDKNRFACPFYQRSPARHRTRRSCVGPGWDEVRRVK